MSDKPSAEIVKQDDVYILVVNSKPFLAYMEKSPMGWMLAGNIVVCSDEEAKRHNTLVGKIELETLDKMDDPSVEFVVGYDEDKEIVFNVTGEFEIAQKPKVRGHFLWFERKGRHFAGLCFPDGPLVKIHCEKESTSP